METNEHREIKVVYLEQKSLEVLTNRSAEVVVFMNCPRMNVNYDESEKLLKTTI